MRAADEPGVTEAELARMRETVAALDDETLVFARLGLHSSLEPVRHRLVLTTSTVAR